MSPLLYLLQKWGFPYRVVGICMQISKTDALPLRHKGMIKAYDYDENDKENGPGGRVGNCDEFMCIDVFNGYR